MKPTPGQLPDDPTLLKEMVELLREELEQSQRREDQLRQQIHALTRRLFGPRAEKVDPNQLQLAFTELMEVGVVTPESAIEEEPLEETSPKRRRRSSTGRGPLPEHLPRERQVFDPRDQGCVCGKCGSQKLKKIGEEISEQLEYVPASFKILEQVRVKVACMDCEEGVVIAPPAPKPIAKGLAGPGLLAHVVTSKYGDHLPLNRLEGIFARHGVAISRSTMCDWVGGVADRLAPIIEHCKSEILKSKIIHTDDTPVPVLDTQRERTRTGRLWVYLGDRDHEHVVFDFTPDRKRAGPVEFLSDFQGYLQADAYAGYDVLYQGNGVIEVACWAHARRKFYEARLAKKKLSFTALAFIRQLYDVEKKAKGLEAEERYRLRQDHAVPILKAFEAWLLDVQPKVLPKSLLGQAITYACSQWRALCRYVEDGNLEIDNNKSERALRCVAIGRKNWLFAGNDEGGRRAAILFSVIASCKHHGVDPFAYLRDVLARLAASPETPPGELTPLAWARGADRDLALAS